MEILGQYPFRVTRSADQALEEEEADDLLEAMEELLHTRHHFSRAVRLEIDESMPDEVRDLLARQMQLDDGHIYVHSGLLSHNGLWAVYGLDRPELKDEPWVPPTQPGLADLDDGPSLFSRLADGDRLVHLPYDAFGTSVGAFIAAAAADPRVVAIKQTLYRTDDPDDPAIGGESSIVESLMRAARSGKQVVVLVELKARFDEEANINWARMLEEAGVHVVYGVTGLKTHSKTALVVRREGDRLVRYSHIGTGNYNPKTARIYEDLGLFTANPEIGADLSELFNVLTGYSRQKKYRKIWVAPTTLRTKLSKQIRNQAKLGTEGRIVWKLNHVIDPKIMKLLYEASQAGVQIDLVIRGVCGVRPGVEGLSENIRVRSIVGKYLEHSRIFRFGSGDDAVYFFGSADMMQRNLNSRVEAMTPIEDPELRRRLEEILQICLADDSLAWELHGDGSWTKVPTIHGLNTHLRLESLALARARGAGADPEHAPDTEDVVMAAGGIVHRRGDEGAREVLVAHRPRYDDWSFPKGKLTGEESEAEAALREVREETGYNCELGPEIGAIEYLDPSDRRKIVRYWAMNVIDGAFASNDEVDEVRWVDVDSALDSLTYDRDRALLRTFVDLAES
jgi:polyphosphate kinase